MALLAMIASRRCCVGRGIAGEDDPLRRLLGAVERLANRDDVEESVYLDACNALKDLYPATNLYQLTYTIFFNDGGAVLTRERTVVMERHGTIDQHYGWSHVLERGALPDNMHGLCLYAPFHCGDEQAMVTSVKPYLKRGREAARCISACVPTPGRATGRRV